MDKRQQGEVFLFNKKTSYFYLINFIFYLIKKTSPCCLLSIDLSTWFQGF